MKAQLAAAKRVARLREKLHNAPPEKKEALRAKLASAKASLKAATKEAKKVTKKLDAARVAKIKERLTRVKNPEKKEALIAQLKAAKRVAELREKLFHAPYAKKAAIKAKLERA